MTLVILAALVTLGVLGLLLVLGCLSIAWLATCTSTAVARASCAWPCPSACSPATPCWWGAWRPGRDASPGEEPDLWC